MAKLTFEEVIAKVKAGESLKEEDLSGIDLRLANLSGIDLRRAKLSGADLSRADLTGANLRFADLLGERNVRWTGSQDTALVRAAGFQCVPPCLCLAPCHPFRCQRR